MRGMHAKTVASQNRRVKDKLQGQTVVIIGGPWKGHRGRVVKGDDKQFIVEITYKCQKVAIDKELVQAEEKPQETTTRGGESQYGGATVYDVGKTPMNYNTPSYYPSGQQWGAFNSPAYNVGTEYD